VGLVRLVGLLRIIGIVGLGLTSRTVTSVTMWTSVTSETSGMCLAGAEESASICRPPAARAVITSQQMNQAHSLRPTPP
jgi:hypothetical protein